MTDPFIEQPAAWPTDRFRPADTIARVPKLFKIVIKISPSAVWGSLGCSVYWVGKVEPVTGALLVDASELTRRVRNKARQLGARLVGITDVDRLAAAPKGHRPEDFLPGARSVIVLGLPILPIYARYPEFMRGSDKVPEELPLKPKEFSEETFRPRLAIADHVYRRCAYELLNLELQRISFYAALQLEELGYRCIYLPTSYGSTFSWNMSNPRPNYMGPFSFRHAAVAAGLGELGLNNLLLTPQYGPLQRLVAVITTAELKADALKHRRLCLAEKCRLCIEACPGQCFGETVQYDCGGVPVRVAAMDKSRCSVPCTRQCLFKCPLGLKGTANSYQ